MTVREMNQLQLLGAFVRRVRGYDDDAERLSGGRSGPARVTVPAFGSGGADPLSASCPMRLFGLAVPYDAISDTGRGKNWRFRPGAFKRSLHPIGLRRRAVMLLINHDPDRELGSTRDPWFKVWEDEDRGVMCSIDTSYPGGAAVAERVKHLPTRRHNLSAGFKAYISETHTLSDREVIEDVSDAMLKEISIVPAGAFSKTFLVLVP